MSGAPQPYNVLAEIERRELKILLGKLSTEDIISLMDTVCNRMVTTESREGESANSLARETPARRFPLVEALENILTYSESAKQLLRRKKVRREHIFQYLAENQVYASASADKTTLMKKVLELWGTPADAMPVDVRMTRRQTPPPPSDAVYSREKSVSATVCVFLVWLGRRSAVSAERIHERCQLWRHSSFISRSAAAAATAAAAVVSDGESPRYGGKSRRTRRSPKHRRIAARARRPIARGEIHAVVLQHVV